MKRYLLDSNAVTSLINKREPLFQRSLEARQAGARIGTCEPVVAELCYGLELSESRDKNYVRLRRALRQLVCWPLDRQASETFGRIAAELKRRGRPMLGAIALSLGNCTVITTDGDLSDVPGLDVENWENEEP